MLGIDRLGRVDFEQRRQNLAGPAINIVLRDGRPHSLHAPLAFGGSHGERLVHRLRKFVYRVRVEEDGVR